MIFKPRAAYNLGAARYDDWAWQHFWRRNEQPVVLKHLLSRRGVTLDIGCGTGYFLEALHSKNRGCVGMDISEGMLAVARQRLGKKFPLVQGDACALPFIDQSFSSIMCARVLTHINDPERAVEEISRVAARKALVAISDIDPEHRYVATKVPSDEGSLEIETFKHEPEFLLRLTKAKGFKLLERINFRADTMDWVPPLPQLRSIDRTGSRAVSYVLILSRR